MRNTWVLSCSLALAAPLAAQDRGLSTTADALGSGRWQARVERDAPSQAWSGSLPATVLGQAQGEGWARHGVRLFGDYQFSRLRLGASGGLRLTGGLLLNLRSSGLGTPTGEATGGQAWSGSGFAGVGYAGGALDGTWRFSADLGVTGLAFGQSRPGLGNAEGSPLAPGWRSLQPLVRLGMRLAF